MHSQGPNPKPHICDKNRSRLAISATCDTCKAHSVNNMTQALLGVLPVSTARPLFQPFTAANARNSARPCASSRPLPAQVNHTIDTHVYRHLYPSEQGMHQLPKCLQWCTITPAHDPTVVRTCRADVTLSRALRRRSDRLQQVHFHGCLHQLCCWSAAVLCNLFNPDVKTIRLSHPWGTYCTELLF